MAMKKVEKTMKPIYEVQKEAHEKYLVNPRTFQWYVTKGLLPKAKKIGRESFYDVTPGRGNVYHYLAVIKLLQNLYGLETDRIKELVDLYKDQIQFLSEYLNELAQKYPSGIPVLSDNWSLHKVFLELISGDKPIEVRGVNLVAMKKQVEKDSGLFI